jgi:hypothetical protein
MVPAFDRERQMPQQKEKEMFRFIRFAACALLAWCLLPTAAQAYRYAPGYPRWESSKMPIKFYVTYADSYNWGGRTKEQVKKMVEDAFKMWMDANCHSVVFQFAGFTLDQAGNEDGKNIITWVGGLPGVS